MLKKKKIILLIVSFLTVWIFSLFYISSVINEDKVRSVANHFVKSQLGEMEVEIGKIQYSIFPMIRIHLENFIIGDKHKSKLVSMRDIEIKLSLATYMLKKGVVDIKSNDLILNFEKNNNFNLLFKLPALKNNSDILTNLKVNFKTENAKLKLNRNTNQANEIHFSKLIIKGIQPNNNPAFEAVIELDQSWSQTSFAGALICIGDVNLEKLIYNRSLDMNLFVSSDKLQIKDQFVQLPPLKVRTKINSDDLNTFKAMTSLEVGSFMTGTSNVVYNGEILTFNDIDFTLIPKDGAHYFGQIIEAALTRYIKDNNFEIQFLGQLIWDFKRLTPHLKISSTNNFNFFLSDNFVLKSSLEATYNNDSLSVFLRSSAGSSNLVLSMVSSHNLLNTQLSSDGFELSPKQVQPLMSFVKDLLPLTLGAEKNNHYVDQLITKRINEFKTKNLQVDLTNIVVQKLSDQVFSFNASFKSDNQQDEIKKLALISDEGSIQWQASKDNNKRGDFIFKNFLLSDLLSYLANPVAGYDGIVTGKLQASFIRFAKLEFLGDIKINKFSIENFDIAKNLKNELEQIGFERIKLEKTKWLSLIDQLMIKFSLNEKKLNLTNLKLSDSNQMTFLQGNISPNKKSMLFEMRLPTTFLADAKKILKRSTVPVEFIFTDGLLDSSIAPQIKIPLPNTQ